MTNLRLPFEYQVEDDGPRATAWGGLPVLFEAMDKWGITDVIRRCVKLGGRRKFESQDIIKALVLTLAAGGDCVDDVELFRADEALKEMLNQELPAAETVRQALDLFHSEELVEVAQAAADKAGGRAFVPEESERLAGLRHALRQTAHEAQRRFPVKVATLDIDATIIESHKQSAQPHYKNGLGYQPQAVVWAEQDLVVDDEFRDGNVPAHFDALGVAQRAFASLPPGIEVRRLRADRQMYSTEALQWLLSERIEFAVGIVKRAAFDEVCAAQPEPRWQHLETRTDSRLDVCEVEYCPERMRHAVGLRYIAIRLTPLQGELLDPSRSVRHLGVVTNRAGDIREILKWYWAKAGTVEHVHDVMKNELGAGVLPSGRFGANAAWYRISALTYNLLSILRRIGSEKLHNARPKRLRLYVFTLPVVLARHARKLVARIVRWRNQMHEAMQIRTAV
jgi:hypothetical protein